MKRFSIVAFVLLGGLALACSACRDSGKAANQGNKDAIAGIGNAVTNPSVADGAPAAGGTAGATGGTAGADGAAAPVGTDGKAGTTGDEGTATAGANGAGAAGATVGATAGAAGSGAAGTTGGSADATGTGTVGGATATSGATGTSAATGTTATSGATGTTAATGTSGASAATGTTGTTAATGTSGASGTIGTTAATAATGTTATTGTLAASRKNIPAVPGPDWQGKPKEYGIKVVKEYPHDETSYTQGLFFQGDHLIETTGQKGESTLRKVDLNTGKALKRFDFDRKYFLEGSVELNGKIFILTWLNKVAFIYDASSLEYLQTFSYPREGWGLTTDGTQLIASDGSSKLFFMDERFQLKKTLQVRLDGKPLRALNELEWIGGKVWANVYLTDMIVVIDPQTGNVEAKIDCTGLLPEALRDEYTDVLNGIAFNPADGKLYLTGKYWKRLYEVELVER